LGENVAQGFFVLRGFMNEIWKDVLGYEDRYQVSDLGNVRSIGANINCSGIVKGKFTSFRKGKLLRPGRMPGGHLSVALGRGNSQCVHKLVLNAFVGVAPERHECLHANGIPSDNRLSNLRWGTRSENIKDKTLHGLSKLKPQDIIFIKTALKNNYYGLQANLARQFNVKDCTISDIKKGRTHV
jgi:hypothetical protein